MIEKQTKINQGLNKQFSQLAIKANEIVGKHITLQFQVFNMDDISIDTSSLKVSNKDDSVSKTSGKGPVDPFDNIVKNTLTGAGTGFGAGIVLPGIGNIAGALVGGIAGLISGIMQNKAEEENSVVYFVDLNKMKSAILKEVQKNLDGFVKEMNANIDTVNKRYMEFVEKQMDGFIKNLKDQLDMILGEFMKNKHNIESHVQHMNAIQQQMIAVVERVEEIRYSSEMAGGVPTCSF